MFTRTYLYGALLIILISLTIYGGCGGGGNSAIVPSSGTTPTQEPASYNNPTPTPVLTNVSVSGYIYAGNTVTEDGETVPRINVLEVPAYQADSSGNEPFVKQVANSLQQDYPEDWAKPDVQVLYAQLNKTLSESKPLPEYNAQAQVCSAYDDTSISVGSDGHFDNTVLTGATDSNVKLEVALGEDNYAEVETLPSSVTINSSDATSAVLKSCPEKIFAFPGEIVIFKVYSEPGINLKSAGLKFTLNNTSIGCIIQPVYLCLFGAHKYQVAYGCVYIKPGLDTPVDTMITAKLNSGQSMSIFLEVIKKTASVSGTVYTGGNTLVKGYVKSLGPKAYYKIDSSGNYSLPKVFMGHSRSVIATWWTSENGQKIRHREEKVIDLLNADVTGFYFGVPPTPTPTPTITPFTEEYRDYLSTKIIDQKQIWQEELGYPEGMKKTAEWINGNITDPPLPSDIKNDIEKAVVGEPNPYIMFLYFKDGYEIMIDDSDIMYYLTPVPTVSEVNFYNNELSGSADDFPTPRPITVKNSKILLLGPAAYENTTYNKIFLDSTKQYLEGKGYTVTRKRIMDYTLDTPEQDNPDTGQVRFYYYKEWPGLKNSLLYCEKLSDDIPRPTDFDAMDEYGVVYIYTHGFHPDAVEACKADHAFLMACPMYENDPDGIDAWKEANKGEWLESHQLEFGPLYEATKKKVYMKNLLVKSSYFTKTNKDFSGSIVYLNACYGWNIYEDKESTNCFNNPKVFISPKGGANKVTAAKLGDKFFEYMLGSINFSVPITPLNVRNAYVDIKSQAPDNLFPPYDIKIYTGPLDIHDNTYFPATTEVTVHKN